MQIHTITYSLFVAMDAEGNIEADSDRDTLLERWGDVVGGAPDEIREIEIIRSLPAPISIELPASGLTVKA